MAPHALCSNETGLARLTVEDNGLMTAIATGNLTTATTHTFLAVDLGIDNGITVKVGIGAVGYPARSQLSVVETDGADGTRGVAMLTGFRTGCILAQQAAAGFFVDINSFHIGLCYRL